MNNVKTGTDCTELLGERSFETSVTVLYTLYTFLDTRDSFEQEGVLTFRHRASCVLGQAFHYSPENAFYIFNQQIYFIN